MAPLLLANSTRDFSLRLDLPTRGRHSFGRPSTIVIFFIPVLGSLTTATVDGNLNLAVILFEPSFLINPSPLPHRFLGTWCHLRPLILVGLGPDQDPRSDISPSPVHNHCVVPRALKSPAISLACARNLSLPYLHPTVIAISFLFQSNLLSTFDLRDRCGRSVE